MDEQVDDDAFACFPRWRNPTNFWAAQGFKVYVLSTLPYYSFTSFLAFWSFWHLSLHVIVDLLLLTTALSFYHAQRLHTHWIWFYGCTRATHDNAFLP